MSGRAPRHRPGGRGSLRGGAALVLLALIAAAPAAARQQLSGYIAAQWRGFPDQPLDVRQHGGNASLSAEPEYYREWDGGRQALTVTPFLRLDGHDEERTHADLRELYWLRVGEGWELRVGVNKVFWGVAESQHLVDVVNQTDLVENLDGEDKLGQPMIDLALVGDAGTLGLFVLPGFRERTFPGAEGRPRTQPRVDAEAARFESADGEDHVDYALRYTRVAGDWDLGFSYFRGTSREPRLVPGLSATGEPVLIPFYDQIAQVGIDLQATKGDWLWKLEAIGRNGQGEDFAAFTGGFEYTFVGVLDSAADLGVLVEYLYDDRGAAGPAPFQDDLFAGFRLTLNDAQSSEILAGVIADRSSGARFYNLEASRRLGRSFKLAVEMRVFSGLEPSDPFFGLRADDYLQVELAWYF